MNLEIIGSKKNSKGRKVFWFGLKKKFKRIFFLILIILDGDIKVLYL